MTSPALPPSNPDALDADILLAITSVQTAGDAAPGDAKLAARVRRRLMTRIADASTPEHLTVKASDDTWHPFGAGIERKVLHQDGSIMSYLLRIAPGAVLRGHHHPVDEECVVLTGDLRIGNALQLHAGGFHLGRKDVLHAAITSDGGAVIYLRGAAPMAELLI
jgi:anti-sigma factor ChrR (cupin superfamily)